MTRTRLLPFLALAGCGLGEPAGAPQSWPPPLGAAVEAALAADLDGDGVSELAIVSSGNSSQAGAYFMHGDASLASGVVPAKFAAFAPLPVTAPAAFATIPDRVFIAYAAGARVELARFDHAFAAVGRPLPIALAPSQTVLWIAAVGGVATQGVVVGTGQAISYVPDAAVELTIAPTIAPPVVLGSAYNDGGNQTLLVASATDAQYGVVSPAGVIGTWSSLRSGPAWVAQTTFDLDRDGYPELLGYDPAMHAVCFAELSFGRTGCLTLTTTTAADATQIVVGDFQGTTALDIVVVFSGATTADVAIVGDITYDGDTLTAAAQGFSGAQAIPQARWMSVARGAGHKAGLVGAAAGGSLVCSICN